MIRSWSWQSGELLAQPRSLRTAATLSTRRWVSWGVMTSRETWWRHVWHHGFSWVVMREVDNVMRRCNVIRDDILHQKNKGVFVWLSNSLHQLIEFISPQSIPFVMYESPFEIAKMVVDLQILNTLRNDEASLVGEFKFVLMTAYISDRKWDNNLYIFAHLTSTFVSWKQSVRCFCRIRIKPNSNQKFLHANPNQFETNQHHPWDIWGQ